MRLIRVLLVAGIVMALATGLTLQGFARSEDPDVMMEPDLELTETMEAWVLSQRDSAGVHVAVFGEYRLIMVSLGEKPSGGYDVTIKRATRGDQGPWVVEIEVNEPGSDDMVSQAFTYPYALVAVGDDEVEMPVRIIDVGTGEAWIAFPGQ